MALDNLDEITDPRELIRLAKQYEYGMPQRGALLDRAVAAADRSGDLRMRFDAREQRFWAAALGGEAELSLALFAWCQRTADENPQCIEATEILWLYKIIFVALPLFARISQRQIDEVSAQMLQRYQANGVNMRPVYAKRSDVALSQGWIEEAGVQWDRAMEYPRDNYADCRACELDYSIQLRTLQHRFDDVIEAAAPIMAGDMKCAEVPHKTQPRVMLSLYALGRLEEARSLAAGAYHLVRDNPDFVQEVAMLIEFYVAEQALPRAAEMAIRHLPWLKQIRNDKQQYHFLRALRCLLGAMSVVPERSSRWSIQLLDVLDVVCGFIEPCAGTEARLMRITASIDAKGWAQACALDGRNGNDYLQRQWREPAFVVTAP